MTDKDGTALPPLRQQFLVLADDPAAGVSAGEMIVWDPIRGRAWTADRVLSTGPKDLVRMSDAGTLQFSSDTASDTAPPMPADPGRSP